MNTEKLKQISLQLTIPNLVKMIEKNNGRDFRQSVKLLYNSQLFEDLDDEKTKIWHFSDILLYDLLQQELTTGKIEYPDV